MHEIELSRDDEDLKFLEQKLGIKRNEYSKNDHSEKKRKVVYEKIEQEGMGNNFMSMLDEIISNVKNRKEKENRKSKNFEKKKNFEQKKIQTRKLLDFSKSSFLSADCDSITKWQFGYKQKFQGLLNRLSEGNMTLIANSIDELLKSTIRKAYYSDKIKIDLLLKFKEKNRKIFVNYSDLNCFGNNRLFLIAEFVQNDLRDLFIQSCILQPYVTVSLITVYSAVICSIGTLMGSDEFFKELISSLNKIYNITLNDILKTTHINGTAEIYNNKLRLRHIVISIITIYRCGFISGKVIESYIITGIKGYSPQIKSNILYWECFLDNVLTILRGSAIFLKEESISMYENIIESLATEILNYDNSGGFLNDILFKNLDNCLNKQRLKFIIEELNEWKKSLQNPLIRQRLRKRQGLIERQLYTVHNWSLNCSLIKHLQILPNKKSNLNLEGLEFISYLSKLTEYNWRIDLCDKNFYDSNPNITENFIKKICNYYKIDISKDQNANHKDLSRHNVLNNKTSIFSNDNLLELASKIRLSSDVQRGIFVALMGAKDAHDAIQRIMSLNLAQSHTYVNSVVNVILLSSFYERVYNQFYYQVLKGLTELSTNISKKLVKETVQIFSQQFRILHTFSIRKLMNFSQLVKDCIIGEIFDLRIIRFLQMGDLHSITDSIGLFLKELVISLIKHQSKVLDDKFVLNVFKPVRNMLDIKEMILLILQTLIVPASKLNAKETENYTGVSQSQILMLFKELSN